jgi:hypothetical protein
MFEQLRYFPQLHENSLPSSHQFFMGNNIMETRAESNGSPKIHALGEARVIKLLFSHNLGGDTTMLEL